MWGSRTFGSLLLPTLQTALASAKPFKLSPPWLGRRSRRKTLHLSSKPGSSVAI
ncbi:hypothetical protein PF005_g15066 [Phytophthora fragariae]|uniref:RxLR effector protein n=2 Tax=Phytophthora TaxID=4783 RepID=A0A6A4BZ32_9STRA|nr:hypothetical protein PF003_g40094 [Phytophthora fragariae]KAE8974766.1 hypothetical protein PR002_g25803 [Phytophthora rubi]KAE8925498.1 hypothetical protein PF009_g24296 [Phytophthora fragariae]KAE8977307.1 hypothetical protein PF011_g23702 [Phytophthora fragariae]KAE8979516.1 hypothetical protein PR001_g24533 [Phytophthora rubi]